MKSMGQNKCRSLAPFAEPFVQIFIEFVKVMSADGVAVCRSRLQRASEDDNAWRLHDSVTSVANDIMKYNVMARRKWLFFLRVISFNNLVCRKTETNTKLEP